RHRLAELAVELFGAAGDLDRAELLAVGAGHVKIIGVVLLLADRLHVRARGAAIVDDGDQFVVRLRGGAHALRIEPPAVGLNSIFPARGYRPTPSSDIAPRPTAG